MPNGSSKFASFSVFCKLTKPHVFVINLSKNWRYRPRWHGQYCVSTEKQFGIVLVVTCEVALRSKSAQIVSANVYCEASLDHWTYDYCARVPHQLQKRRSQKSFILVCSRVSVFWVLEQTYIQKRLQVPSPSLCSFPLPSASNRWVVNFPSYCATRLLRGEVYWRFVHSQHHSSTSMASSDYWW